MTLQVLSSILVPPIDIMTLSSGPNMAPNFFGAVANKSQSMGAMLLSGRNPACPISGTFGDLWGVLSVGALALGGVRTNPTAAFTLGVCSDSASDAAAGVGAQQITVLFLDISGAVHTAVYALNGLALVTTPIIVDGVPNTTAQSAWRINGAEVTAIGSTASNVGNIYVFDSSVTLTSGVPQTAAKVFDLILPNDNVASASNFTIPANYYGAIIQTLYGVNDATATLKYTRFRLQYTTGVNGIYKTYYPGGGPSSAGATFWEPVMYPVLQPLSELRMQATAAVPCETSCLNELLLWPAN